MYDERLGVPLRWWALATMFLASMLLAFLVATPPLGRARPAPALLVALACSALFSATARRGSRSRTAC